MSNETEIEDLWANARYLDQQVSKMKEGLSAIIRSMDEMAETLRGLGLVEERPREVANLVTFPGGKRNE